MLLTRQRRKPDRSELNMAPMIDVVFLLLIFFMCTSSFDRPENEMRSDLPRTGGAVDKDDFDPVRIRLTGRGQAVRITCDNQPCPDFETLVKMLKARRAIADVPVVIRGDGTVPVARMIGALDACHQADLKRVAFAAEGV
jgi:biopolymer transport protein ExbD